MAVLVVVAALGLGACGGDDEGNNGSADTGASATDTTGTTETTGKTGTDTTETRERTGKTTTSERKRDDKGGSGGNSGSGGGGSDDSSGGGSSGSSKEKSSNTQLTDKNVKSTAKTVCSSFLPTQLEKDLKSGKKSAEDIAKDYSQAFPSDQRKSAHDGCLEGLKKKD